jgi:hypothetical protein
MVVTRCAAIAALFVLLHGCGQPTCGTCIDYGLATFQLACDHSNLTSVVVDGPCLGFDAGLSWYAERATKGLVEVASSAPGTCHVELTFATGFTYSTYATFDWVKAADCGGCPDFIGPTNGPFTVHNPSGTCTATDGGTDASSDAS